MLGVGHSHLQTFRLSFKELQTNLGFFFRLKLGVRQVPVIIQVTKN